MKLKMMKGYKDLPEYWLSLNALAGKVFGIEFERWYQLGSLAPEGIRKVVFHFTPDFADVPLQCQPAESTGDAFLSSRQSSV
jgi:hypothetical protein